MRSNRTGRTCRRTRYVAGGVMCQTADGSAYTWSGRLWVWRWQRDPGRLQRDIALDPVPRSWIGVAYPPTLDAAVRYSLAWESGFLAGKNGGGR